MDKRKKIRFIDGSSEQQNQAVNEFLSSFTKEEVDYSMSDELSYLDDIEQ